MQKTFLLHPRTLALSFVMALILTMFSLPSFAAGLSGNGSAESPYLIATEADLIAFRDKVNGGETSASARLTSDIQLTGNWTAIGSQDAPFTGTFDGDGHSINNFMTAYYDPMAALFGHSSGTIRDLTVDTGYNYLFGGDYAAGICAINRGTIQNCTSKGYIYGYTDRAFVGGIASVNFGTISGCSNTAFVGGAGADSCAGGIVGVSAAGQITNCTNTGSISASDAYKQQTEICAGGIVGLNYKSTVDCSTNTGSIFSDSATGYTGGVAGLNNGIVSNSLNAGSLSSPGLYGGIAGYVFTNSDTGMTAQVRCTLDTSGNLAYGKNEGGFISSNFYKSATGGSAGADQMPVTADQLKSGEITFRLNGNNTTDPVWGQDLASDAAPVIGSEKIVYAKYQGGSIIGYTNDPRQTHVHTFDESGKCDVADCGYESVSLDGWTLTLDGALGVTFYYKIDPMYLADGYDVSVTFTMDGKSTSVPLDETYSYQAGENTVYGFRFYVDSDKATHDISPVVTVEKDGITIVTLTQDQTYRIYDYLKTIINADTGTYSSELVELAKALATYDYYANEYFKYSDAYKPEIRLLSLNGVTGDVLTQYQLVDIPDDQEYPTIYYASNLYLQEAVFPRYYVALADPSANLVDTNNLYMGYRITGSGDLFTYVKTEKYSSFYAGNTAKRPASELGTTYDMAFFVKEGSSYRQVSQMKQVSVYSYIYTAVTNTNAKPTLQEAMKALYLYGEAAKAYFASVN